MPGLKNAFRKLTRTIPLNKIVTQRRVHIEQRRGAVYKQIASSIAEVGIIEAPVVFASGDGTFLLLDGHLRLDVLKCQGKTEVICIVSTDDEAYTYNRRVNSIPPIVQHLMLLKALKSGLSEERVAASLNVDIAVIRRKRDMLDGICPEAVEILQTKNVSATTFVTLKQMKPLRQIAVAEHMVASSLYSGSFVKALLYASKPDQLTESPSRAHRTITDSQAKKSFAHETEGLLVDFKALEADLGKEILILTVVEGYVSRLFKNEKVSRYMARRQPDLFSVLSARA